MRSINEGGTLKRGEIPARTNSATKKRLAKRERLFDAAARHLNSRGIAGTSLQELAAELGLSRSTLYYYVRDRDDLAFQCYQRSCLALHEDLATAREAGSDPASKIRLFVEANLAPDRAEKAVVAGLAYFADTDRSLLQDQIDHSRGALSSLIERGIASGHFRFCNPDIAADLLIGMLDWIRIAKDWVDAAHAPTFRSQAIATIEEAFLHGVGAGAVEDVNFDISVQDVLAKTEVATNPREELIAAKASALFNAHGVEGTALEDVASALGMTRGVIYHYFDSKADLVIYCYLRAYRIYGAILEYVSALKASGRTKIAMIFNLNAQAIIGGISPMRSQPGFSPLNPIWTREKANLNQPVIDAFTRVWEEGVADHSLLELDALPIGLVTAGAVHGLAHSSSYGPSDVRHVAHEVASLMIWGLEKR